MKQFIAGLSLAGLLVVSGTAAAATPSATPSGLEASCVGKTVAPASLCQYGNGEETDTTLPHLFYGYVAAPDVTPSVPAPMLIPT